MPYRRTYEGRYIYTNVNKHMYKLLNAIYAYHEHDFMHVYIYIYLYVYMHIYKHIKGNYKG